MGMSEYYVRFGALHQEIERRIICCEEYTSMRFKFETYIFGIGKFRKPAWISPSYNDIKAVVNDNQVKMMSLCFSQGRD